MTVRSRGNTLDRVVRKVSGGTVLANVHDSLLLVLNAACEPVTVILPGPTDAFEAMEITIKDASGTAETCPILIDGNGSPIDGSPTFTIETNRDSIDIVFYDGEWHSV